MRIVVCLKRKLRKRSMSSMLHKATEVAEQYSQPLSVMMIDADNLKKVNDSYGHKAGDKLILTISSTIRDCLRTSDIICRYGGMNLWRGYRKCLQ